MFSIIFGGESSLGSLFLTYRSVLFNPQLKSWGKPSVKLQSPLLWTSVLQGIWPANSRDTYLHHFSALISSIQGIQHSALGSHCVCPPENSLKALTWGCIDIFQSRGGNSNPLHYFCLKNSMDTRAWWATVHDVLKSQRGLSMYICVHCVTHQATSLTYFHSCNNLYSI